MNPGGRGCGEPRLCQCTLAWVTKRVPVLKKKRKKERKKEKEKKKKRKRNRTPVTKLKLQKFLMSSSLGLVFSSGLWKMSFLPT